MYKQLYSTFQHWANTGRIFFYSDPHFTDEQLYKHRFSELFKKESINKVLLENILGKDQAESIYTEENIIAALDKIQINNINAEVTKNDCLVILGDIGNTEPIKSLRAGYKVLLTGNHDKGTSNYLKTETENLFDEVYEGPLFISEKILLSHEPVDFPFALNIHGHTHDLFYISRGINCSAEHLDYKPISLDDILKSGKLKDIKDIHRQTIDKATERKNKRTKKNDK